MPKPKPEYVMECDILVIGAGVAGLYSAWRLQTAYPEKKVIVVDKLGRTGGRLQTTTMPIKGLDGNTYEVKDEEGGMRFVPKQHGMPYLWSLIDHFQLPTVPFPMGDDNNRFYIRGTSFTRATEVASLNQLYHLAPNEQNKATTTIIKEVMQSILDQNSGGHTAGNWPNSPETWIEFRNTFTYNGEIINKWGFWSLMRTYGLSEECITMIGSTIGFMGPLEAYINAGEGMQILLDFPATPDFLTLANGYESLPDALEAAIKSNGGTVMLNTDIAQLTASHDGRIIASNFVGSFHADRVVLAIPREPMNTLMEASPGLLNNPDFVNAVNSVKNMELTKVGFYFSERWWNFSSQLPVKLGVTSGPNFSDLPASSVYGFCQYPADPAKDAAYNGPAALTIYTDFDRGNFWMELQNIGEPYSSPEFPENPPGTVAASRPLVIEAMKQFRQIFGLAKDAILPEPVLTAYRVWGQEPYGYGYHQYHLNVDDRNVYTAIWKAGENIFACNEAWSPEQGWVEGSLISADNMLQNAFNLPAYVSK